MLGSLRALMTAQEGGRNLAGNTAWLIGERAVTLTLALFTSVWVARYLGPSAFGTLSYAIALVGLFGTFTYLGFSGVVTRDLVARPEDRDEILGTTFVLKLAGALAAILIILLLAFLWEPDGATRTLLIILACALPFDAFNVIAFYYYSKVAARHAVIASMLGALGSAIIKLAFVAGGLPLVWFAVATAAQALLTALALLFVYRGQGHSPFGWRAARRRSIELLTQSWPLALASVVAAIYLKIDQVMLGQLATPEAVGTYAVAARLSEIWYVLPAAVATSVFPSIVKARMAPSPDYQAKMDKLYKVTLLLGIVIAIPTTLLAGPIVSLLYGPEYRESAAILAIHIWACPGMFMGAILTKWLIAEGYMTFALLRDGLGAVLNIILNWLLIPHYGGIGSAVATVVSYWFSSYAVAFLDKRTRPAGISMTKAIFTPALAVLIYAKRARV